MTRTASKAPNFRAVNAADGVPEIFVFDEIGASWSGLISAELVAAHLQSIGNVAKVRLLVNSQGGDVAEGQAIYNLINQHPAQFEAVVMGMALSTAGWIIQACDDIRFAENAMFMVHDPASAIFGSADEHRAEGALLDTLKGQIVGMFTARTGKPAKKIEEWMTAETWFTAAEAVAAGFGTSIVPNKTSEPANFERKRFKNVPAWAEKHAAPPATSEPTCWRRNLAARRLEMEEKRR